MKYYECDLDFKANQNQNEEDEEPPIIEIDRYRRLGITFSKSFKNKHFKQKTQQKTQQQNISSNEDLPQ